MNKSVIVYGPPGCGKTRFAQRIAKHFGLSTIVDDFNPRLGAALTGTLYLTSDLRAPLIKRHLIRTASFDAVVQEINAAIPLTEWSKGSLPERVGEYNASTQKREDTRRWWDGKHWSYGYWHGDDMSHAQRKSSINPAVVYWRGLAEEPLPVRGAA